MYISDFLEILKKNKVAIIIVILFVTLITISVLIDDYKYDRCIEVEIENLNGCLDEQRGSEYMTCYDDYGTIEDIEWACGEYVDYLSDRVDYGG